MLKHKALEVHGSIVAVSQNIDVDNVKYTIMLNKI